jgi:glycosyltransferase involved in cell wall biosynthesis
VTLHLRQFLADNLEDLRLANRVIAPTATLLQTIESGLQAHIERSVVIPHGCVADFSSKPAVESTDGIVRFGFFGHLHPIKGPDLLLRAARTLPETCRNQFQLHFWGTAADEAYGLELGQLSEGLPATFHGSYVPSDLSGVKLDYAVFASRATESYSLVLDEAWALGLPVLAPDRGALRERVGQTGLLFEPENAHSLGLLMHRAMLEPELRATLQAQIQEPASMEAHGARLLELYGEVLLEGSNPASPDPTLAYQRILRRGFLRERRNLQLRTALGRIEQLEDQVRGLERSMEEARLSVDSERAIEAAYLDEINVLKGELLVVREEYKSLESDRDQVRAHLEQLAQDRDRQQVETHRAWRAVEENHSLIRLLESQIKEQQERADSLLLRAAKTPDQKAELPAEAPALPRVLLAEWEATGLALDQEAQRGRDLAKKVEIRDGELAALKLLLASSQQDREEFRSELRKLLPDEEHFDEKHLSDLFRDVVHRIRDQMQLNAELTRSVTEVAAESQSLEEERDRLTMEVEAYRSHEAQLRQHPIWRRFPRLFAAPDRKGSPTGLRVLMVIHDFLPRHAAGSQVYTFRLAKALRVRGHDVRILTTEAHPGVHSYYVRHREEDDIPIIEVTHQHHTTSFDRTYRDPNMERIFRRFLRDWKPDVLHVQHLHHHSIGYLPIAKEYGLPIVYTLHEYMLLCPRGGQMMREDMSVCERPIPEVCASCISGYELGPAPVDEGRAPLSSRIARHLPVALKDRLRALRPPPVAREDSVAASAEDRARAISNRLNVVKEALAHVDLFLSPSEFLRTKFIECGMIEADRIECSHNGQDGAPFRGHTRVPSKHLRVGYIGTIAEFKGVDVLVRAMNVLLDLPHIEAHIHGSLSTFERFSQELMGSGRHPGLRFHDRYPPGDVGRILSGLDVLVVPSRWYENAPLTIQEAFMAGIPVVASRLGGMAEFVTDGVTGLLFETGNEEDLARCLRRLHDDRAFLASLAPNPMGYKTIETDACLTEERYLRLVATSRKASASEHSKDPSS